MEATACGVFVMQVKLTSFQSLKVIINYFHFYAVCILSTSKGPNEFHTGI